MGIGIAAVLILAALGFLLLRYRRRRKQEAAELAASRDETGEAGKAHDSLGVGGGGHLGPGTPGTPATTAPSELEPNAARPWSLRSELEGPLTPKSMAEKVNGGTPSPQPGQQQWQQGGRPGGLGPVVELPG